MQPGNGIRIAVMAVFGVLLIIAGLRGNPGSMLAALLMPEYMQETTPSSSSTSVTGVVNTNTKNIVPSTGTLTPAQIAQYALGAGVAGGSRIAMAVSIALAESGGKVKAVSSTGDYGLWQINFAAHTNLGYTTQQLFDPATNAAAMVSISQGGANWNPWTTYQTGAYKRYLGQGQAAATGIVAGI